MNASVRRSLRLTSMSKFEGLDNSTFNDSDFIDTKSSNQSASDSDSEEENVDKLSEYEKLRLRNIAERNEFLKSLDLPGAFKELKNVLPSTPKPLKRTNKKTSCEGPSRKSSRIENRARGIKAEVPILHDATNYISVKRDPDYDYRNLGTIKIEPDEFLTKIIPDLTNLDRSAAVGDLDYETYVSSLWAYEMAGEPLKVVPQRIYSMCIHPSTSRKIVFVGSSRGELGVFNVDSEEILELNPHSGPTNCISTSISDPCIVYSTSHDGTVVRTDISVEQLSTVYATNYKASIKHLTWHHQIAPSVLLVGHGNGSVLRIDEREPTTKEKSYFCFERSVRTISSKGNSFHQYLVSSGTGGCAIFDLRANMKQLSNLSHPKGLTSGFFSPDGHRIVTTCNDNNLRVFEVPDTLPEELACTKTRYHNNHTGRWLSVFKAVWHPSRSDIFFVGSLDSERKIEVFNNEAVKVVELTDDYLATIQSVLAIHPTLPLIVGGNSTGRVHPFMLSPSNVD